MEPASLARMSAIEKRFDGVRALDGVDFDLRPGEIHALLGENGAGKSTLIKILTGAYQPDGGTIELGGRAVSFRGPAEAQAAGIATIHQEIHLVPTLDAVANLHLGREPRRPWGLIDRRRMRREAAAMLDRYGVAVDLDRPVGELGVAVQQMIAIARALSLGGRILVMDEPTSALTHREVDHLLAITDRVRAAGVGVVYITHRLDEVFRLADRVTVLRDGRRVLSAAAAGLDRPALVRAMLGRGDVGSDGERRAAVTAGERRATVAAGAPVLTAEGLGRAPRVASASLTLGRGMILGLAGLQGSGRTELMRLIFGADRPTAGRHTLKGEAGPHAPAEALLRGLAYLPEDRKADGIVPDLSVSDNLSLVLLPRLTRWGFVDRAAERAAVVRFMARLGVKAASPETRIRDLSGGNQQKVLIARLLCSTPEVLMLDDPMRGIDVGAKADIARLIAELADQGMAVLLTSSELAEIVTLSDRVTVLRDGRTQATLAGSEISFARLADAIAADDPAEAA
jgi:ribose transport system ATP-binding protein